MSTAPVETEATEAEPKPEVQEGGVIEIPPDPPAADPAPKQTRAERRAERGRGYDEEARAARDEARQAREANQRLEVQLAEIRGRMAATAPQADPNEKALEDVEERLDQVLARLGAGDTTAIKERRMLEREKTRLINKLDGHEPGKAIEERIARSIPQPVDPRHSALAAEFPSLGEDAEFRAVASGHVARLVRLEGRDMQNPSVKFATLREGAALAARELGIGGNERTAPTQRDRERVSGTRSGDSGAGGGKVTIHLTDHQKKMAEQLFRDKPAAEAHIEWWKKIGSKIAEKK